MYRAGGLLAEKRLFIRTSNNLVRESEQSRRGHTLALLYMYNQNPFFFIAYAKLQRGEVKKLSEIDFFMLSIKRMRFRFHDLHST